VVWVLISGEADIVIPAKDRKVSQERSSTGIGAGEAALVYAAPIQPTSKTSFSEKPPFMRGKKKEHAQIRAEILGKTKRSVKSG